MGLYFMLTGPGRGADNREKTLVNTHRVEELVPFLPGREASRLREFFPDREPVYAWGANSAAQIGHVHPGDYAVDVDRSFVTQVFEYCFYVQLHGGRLQEFFGWDRELPQERRRPYSVVYFLRRPRKATGRDKRYFQQAFGKEGNPHWLDAQRYFADPQVRHAMERMRVSTVEEFLGIADTDRFWTPPEPIMVTPAETTTPTPAIPASRVSVPPDLEDMIEELVPMIKELAGDPAHQERAHEALVEDFFRHLGYRSVRDIQYRQGHIDILIRVNNTPAIVVEVKRDWGLSSESLDYVNQAYGYSNQVGSPFVMITNGDTYVLYDKRKGHSYDENLICQFSLTKLRELASRE